MIACINRWVLLAALAGGSATAWPLAEARAQSLDQTQESTPYALADALLPYAQRNYARALQLLAPLAEQGTPSHS